MQIKVGTDILSYKRFQKSLKSGGDAFLNRIFLPDELRESSPEQLAGIFSLKEAVMKALELPVGSWQIIATKRKANGKIDLSLMDQEINRNIVALDTSISHDGEWIIAVAVVICTDPSTALSRKHRNKTIISRHFP